MDNRKNIPNIHLSKKYKQHRDNIGENIGSIDILKKWEVEKHWTVEKHWFYIGLRKKHWTIEIILNSIEQSKKQWNNVFRKPKGPFTNYVIAFCPIFDSPYSLMILINSFVTPYLLLCNATLTLHSSLCCKGLWPEIFVNKSHMM